MKPEAGGPGRTGKLQLTRRPAADSDRAFVWHAYAEAYREVATRQFDKWEDGLQEAYFEEKWACNGFEIIEVDGVPEGAIWTTDEGAFLQVREVFLLPERRGQGIGSRLVRHELATARRAGKPLRLRVVKISRAVALYERLGFTVCGETDTQYWMEAV